MNRFSTLLSRSLRLRCPMCGEGKLFRRWFAMHERCPSCGVKFEREAGFFLGSIYFNYGLTALICAIVYPVLLFTESLREPWLTALTLSFAVLFPCWFHHYARSLWLGFDQYCDPRPAESAEKQPASASDAASDRPDPVSAQPKQG